MSDTPSQPSSPATARPLKALLIALGTASVFALFFSTFWDASIAELRKHEAALRADKPGTPAPPFTLADRSGRSVSLADLRGKVVFVNFWATWCAPCREEMPSLVRLARSIDARDAVVVTISVDESWDEVDAFFQGQPPPFVVLRDPDKLVSAAWGTTMFPESYIVTKDGTVAYKIVGGRDWGAPSARRLLERLGVRRSSR